MKRKIIIGVCAGLLAFLTGCSASGGKYAETLASGSKSVETAVSKAESTEQKMLEESEKIAEIYKKVYREALKENADGTLKLTVDAVLPEKNTDKAFSHEVAANLLDVLDVHTIAEKVGLPIEKVEELKRMAVMK